MIETYWPDAATRADFARRAEEAGRANPTFWGGTPALPERPFDGHKGTFGTALAVGGSRGMSGAIALTGAAAAVAGAGLTRIFTPEPILETVAGFAREYTTIPGACDASGRLTSAATEAITREADGATAVAVGPGFGRSAEATRLVVELFFELERPAVFDADALNALAEAGVFDGSGTNASGKNGAPNEDATSEGNGNGKNDGERAAAANRFVGRKPRGARILTPHPGEFARLTGAKPARDLAGRIDATLAFARRFERLWGSAASSFVVALKGAGTVVADGSGAFFVNETGNPSLATGGSGDVLTGVVVGLLAQGAVPLDATRTAVALHGLAADLRSTICSRGAIASDVVRFLPVAFDFYETARASARAAF